MRGEHDVASGLDGIGTGSSPHARGAPQQALGPADRVGIIPACAGSTKKPRKASSVTRNHPRMRGEHGSFPHRMSSGRGSSPHARGARAPHHRRGGRFGIIPACAGSTCRCRTSRRTARDYPRMRGEHSRADFCSDRLSGSSPHARGALSSARVLRHLVGIIPACAESTHGRMGSRAGGRDHPRMRGEHHICPALSTAAVGSSPHARGARFYHVLTAADPGIIPACAGSTYGAAMGKPTSRDHPRMRGEHGFPSTRPPFRKGSSPHARGAQVRRRCGARRVGIIPACAGSTLGHFC